MTTAKQIFNYIAGVNPSSSTISSLGTFVSSANQQVADNLLNEVISNLPKESLAYKIATSVNAQFSEKQLWVIAFELEKNAQFIQSVNDFYYKVEQKVSAKQAASKAKLLANKECSKDVLSSIKTAGKKLGDYYTFLKANKNYAREFFSKKFSQESANEFINL